MTVGIISDVHGNWEALEAVAQVLEGADEIWCLGDIVGYGADPKACLNWCRQRCSVMLKGNHDEAVATLRNLDFFNPIAREAVLWTRRQLSEEDRQFLSSLPPSQRIVREKEIPYPLWLAHGSLREPLEEYILDETIARVNARLLIEAAEREKVPEGVPLVLFFGHSHVAESYIFTDEPTRGRHASFSVSGRLRLKPRSTYLINVGSVGQPRDDVPEGSCALLNTDEGAVDIVRFPYLVEQAARKIISAGLPPELGYRLFYGW